MYELSKQFRFDAAHQLDCEVNTERNRRIHGHSYRAEVTVRGTPDAKSGMIVDLGHFKQALDNTREALDHRYLNDINDLGPGTLENLSAWIWRRLAPDFANLAKVTVHRDSSGECCSYFGPESAKAMTERALVLFSGGQGFHRLPRLGAGYIRSCRNHRFRLWPAASHRTRLPPDNPRQNCRELFPKWKDKLGEDHLLDLAALGAISETALTRDAQIAFEKNGLPNTFVPGRNLLFFTYTAAVAYRRNITHLVGGMCETDYSGYPDCRDATLKALQTAINLGMARDFTIHTPLMWIDKASTWKMAHDLGGEALIELTKFETHTCYLGERGAKHDWGYGCGKCPACHLREKGFRAWKAA